MLHLQPNTTLQGGKYKIEKLLGQGGFGITYLAEQSLLKIKVAIKEFFIRDLCDRDETANVHTIIQADMVDRYRQKFFKEAQILARLNHPGIVRVTDIFEENGTAYYVMEYVEGESLDDIIKRNGPLSEEKALRYISKVADALDYIHQQNVNHLDIKPANIMIRQKDDEPVLIDFGVSKQYDEQKDQTTTTPPGVSNGYSPLEQYKPGGVSFFSPQADIYALGATLYKLLTGDTPPNASDMLNEGIPNMPSNISQNIRKAIEKAMQPRVQDRLKSIKDFISIFKQNNNESDNNAIDADMSISENEDTCILEESIGKIKKTNVEEKDESKKQALKRIKKRKLFIDVVIVISLSGIVSLCYLIFMYIRFSPESFDFNNMFTDIHSFLNCVFVNLSPIIIVFLSFIITLFVDLRLSLNTIERLVNNMVFVSGGSFNMGATSEQGDDAKFDEKPVHQVRLSSYYIGQCEVVKKEWIAVRGFSSSFLLHSGYIKTVFPGMKFKEIIMMPHQSSWNKFQEFIQELNKLTGLQFRLPTEAEWEYAARGGNKFKGFKYAGSNVIDSVAWCDNKENRTDPYPVGQKTPNELGLYDMSGNVWEWCSDIYGKYNSSFQINPIGSSSGSQIVIRGGDYKSDPKCCRVSSRSYDSLSSDNGIRLVLDSWEIHSREPIWSGLLTQINNLLKYDMKIFP